MESGKKSKNFIKENVDSGLDNSSDSDSSCSDEPLVISSDCQDILHNNNERSNLKKFTSNTSQNLLISNKISNPITFNKRTSSNETLSNFEVFKENSTERATKLGFSIELNNTFLDEYEEVLKFYETLWEGQCETVDFNVTSFAKKPEWLNEEKFKRGQQFARDHLFCINFAEMCSLFILFAQKSSLGPLIFTGKSDSPFKSFERYLNTLSILMSWYQDDVWSKNDNAGAKNIKIVRGMHKNVYRKLTSCPVEKLATKLTLGNPNTVALWCPLQEFLTNDFRESLSPMLKDLDTMLLNCKKVWINQADMSMTQFGFVGLAVTYPKSFGIHLASDEDLDAFLHLWRGLGYLLGIKDKYNYCDGNLEVVRKRTKFFLEVIAKPAFREVNSDWEHMCRCLTAGISFYLPQVQFESAFLYLCHVLKIQTPRLKKQMSFKSYLVFQIHRFIFYLMKFSGVLKWLNFRLYEIIKKAQNVPPEVLNKWQNKEFPYMKQEGKCSITDHSIC